VHLRDASRADFGDLLRAFNPLDNAFRWRPLSQAAWFWVHLRLWGPNAQVFHLAGLLCYVANCVLAFAVGRRILGTLSGATLAAGLYATNPVHFQAVAWPAAFTEIASSFFVLVAFLGYLAWVESGFRRPWVYVGSLLALAAALMSREVAVVLPIAMFAHAVVMRRSNTEAGGGVGRGLLLYALAAGLFAARFASRTMPSTGPYTVVFNVTSVENALKYVVWSLGTTKWQLMWVSSEPEPALMMVLGVLALATVVVLAIRWRDDRPSIVFGGAWFAIFLLPALWIPNQFYPYYASLASLGLAMIAATALLRLRNRRTAAIVVFVVLAARLVAIAGEHTVNPVPQMGRVAENTLAAIERSGGLPGVKAVYFVAVPKFDQWAFQFSAMMQFYYPSLERVIYAPTLRDVPAEAWRQAEAAILQACNGRAIRLMSPSRYDPALCGKT
jgi:hypothetical protein